jgi:radical SAM protein with 4Fe4S-binding SPASM domain
VGELRPGAAGADAGPSFDRPYVVSWNLTYRCNLACEHCYLDAGARPQVATPEFSDRGELDTEQCFRVIDEIAAFAPEALTILTGGEPLLRRDILPIVRRAASRGLWVVVGTNGVSITASLARILLGAGVRGMALSLDALDPEPHDRFRRVRGAWANTVEGARILREAGLPFIVQTTVAAHNVDELEALAAFACERLGARVWNLYFLVQTGRGSFVSDIAPEQYDGVLAVLSRLQKRFASRMVVNAKCAPHHVRQLCAEDPSASALKAYSGGAGGCPAGTHYMGIRPNGDVTPCPYLPVFGGNLKHEGLAAVWRDSEPFVRIRQRAALGGRCGACELRGLCGGCRARAYGMTGDYMAEDPLCSHVPGSLGVVASSPPAIEYGASDRAVLEWEPAARERMQRVPAFVRGMVIRAVEADCRTRGVRCVSLEVLERIRAALPTPKVFGRGGAVSGEDGSA